MTSASITCYTTGSPKPVSWTNNKTTEEWMWQYMLIADTNKGKERKLGKDDSSKESEKETICYLPVAQCWRWRK